MRTLILGLVVTSLIGFKSFAFDTEGDDWGSKGHRATAAIAVKYFILVYLLYYPELS